MSADAEAGCGCGGYDFGEVTDYAADEAIAAAVARLRREAADCDRHAELADRRGLPDRYDRWRADAAAYERAARLVAARGDPALEPASDRTLPAETIDTKGLL